MPSVPPWSQPCLRGASPGGLAGAFASPEDEEEEEVQAAAAAELSEGERVRLCLNVQTMH